MPPKKEEIKEKVSNTTDLKKENEEVIIQSVKEQVKV
jgi:hypothetical protein